MSEVTGAVAGAGEPRRRSGKRPIARRVGAWLIWWTLLMAFWVWIDDSLLAAELVVGAIVAATGATLVELVQHESASPIRIRLEWLNPALRLPLHFARDVVTVFSALIRRLGGGEVTSGFVEESFRAGGDDSEAATRRALALGGRSFAPNTVALGIDRRRNVIIEHRLVLSPGKRRR